MEGNAELLGGPRQVGVGLVPEAGAQGGPEPGCGGIGRLAELPRLHHVRDQDSSGLGCEVIVHRQPDLQAGVALMQPASRSRLQPGLVGEGQQQPGNQ